MIWLIVSLLLIQFLLSLTSFSLRDFSRSRLEEISERASQPERFRVILREYEGTLLASDTLGLVFTFALGGSLWFWFLPDIGSFSWLQGLELGGVVLAAILLLILFPFVLSRVAGEGWLYHAWPLLKLLTLCSQPWIRIVFWIDQLLHRIWGITPPGSGDGALITEELRTVLDAGEREGILESSANTMINRVIEFHEADVADIMTPRTRMACVSKQATLETARSMLIDEGHSRVPVIGKTTDDIVGILYAKDILSYLRAIPDSQADLSSIVRQPLFVPETMGIDDLLKTFKRERVHLAIVLDEYGGVSGLITLEDILEEIVGEIVDEYDLSHAEPIRHLEPGRYEADATVHIDDLNSQLELNIPSDNDYDTLGGFVFSQLGRVPIKQDSLEWNGTKFIVLDADQRKVIRVRIEKPLPEQGN